LVVTVRVSRVRAAPVLVILVVFLIALVGAEVSRMGFAWVQPESFLAEEIAKDPTSPIAVAHEMARKNGTRPGGFNPVFSRDRWAVTTSASGAKSAASSGDVGNPDRWLDPEADTS